MYEIGGVVILGILSQWLAWRLRVPAILPLMVTGLLVGPVAQYYLGHRIINPRFDAEAGVGLFPGNLLYQFVNLAIALILFEGGLTLNRQEIKGLERSVIRLTTVGALTTALIGGLAAHYIAGLNWRLSFLFSSLIVVTGPTVIAPILRHLNLKKQISTVLKWESIIIDPVGAFLAVLVFNFISASYLAEETTTEAFITFGRSVFVGLGLGVILGGGLYFFIKRLFVPRYLLSVFTLALVMGSFLLSDLIAHESGLLTAVVMGATLANLDVPYFKDIIDFKESLTLLLISLLFIMLSADMTVAQLELVARSESLLLFLVIILVARPLGVFWSMRSSDLSWRDKAFISWVGPRGIVAAGVASLFGVQLQEMGVPGAEMITPLVFLVVLGSVLLNATLANLVGKQLGVMLPERSDVLIYGDSEGARTLAKTLQDGGRHVVLVGGSRSNIAEAKELGLEAIFHDIYSDTLLETVETAGMGYLLGLSGSDEDNMYLLNRYGDITGSEGAFRLIVRKELQNYRPGKQALFSPIASSLLFNRTARQFPEVQETEIQSEDHLREVIKALRQNKFIPLYITSPASGHIRFVTADEAIPTVTAGDTLHFLGDPNWEAPGMEQPSETAQAASAESATTAGEDTETEKAS